MKKEHLRYLRCPECKNELSINAVDSEHNEKIEEGELCCTTCNALYPIINYIPRFVPVENYASGFGLQWNIHVSTQYDNHTGLPLSENRFFNATNWPRTLNGELILEAGSGSGRFTEHAVKTGAMVISFDYSNAVEANYNHNGDKDNLLIVQADIMSPPTPPYSFDKIFCFGVLQHTPAPHKSFLSLTQQLKPAGSLVVDVYKKNKLGKFLSFTPAPPTKYYIRPITTRMDPGRLYENIKSYINFMWPICKIINKIPKFGRNINWMLLVADHGNLDISDNQAKQWAYLNTFDMLAPRYDSPQTLSTVKQWFSTAQLENCHVAYGYNGIVGRGNRPREDNKNTASDQP